MSIDLSLAPIIGFVLALIRTSAWMILCPPFNGRMVPRVAKIGIAGALALPLSSQLPAEKATLAVMPFLTEAMVQLATGLILGFFALLVFSVFQAAGSYLDTLGGFAMSNAMDPFTNNTSSAFGRFYQLIAVMILFAINGHLMMIKGFMTSFEAVPLGVFSSQDYAGLVVKNLAYFGVASLEIVGPLVACYFLTEIASGLLNKAAPQLNVLMFGFPLKILLTIIMVAIAIPLVVPGMHSVLNRILNDGALMLNAAIHLPLGSSG